MQSSNLKYYFCVDQEMETGVPHGILISITFQASIALQNLNKNIGDYVPALNSLEEIYKMSRIGVEVEEICVNIRASILYVVGHQN